MSNRRCGWWFGGSWPLVTTPTALTSETALAQLWGACPIPTGFGNINRHQLQTELPDR
ncbi:MAG: hypothetical protein ACYDC5_07930 [Candidatus Dormibacteria bacterium]